MIEYNSYFFAKRLLLEGNFLSVFTRLLIQDELDRGVVKIVRVPEVAWNVTYHAIFRRGAQRSPAAQVLLDEIRKACAACRHH
jgi:DNA-binding transcriptional LysR family regulator